MKRKFSAGVWRGRDWHVAQCLQVYVASQGESEEDAIENLREALELHFEPPALPARIKRVRVSGSSRSTE